MSSTKLTSVYVVKMLSTCCAKGTQLVWSINWFWRILKCQWWMALRLPDRCARYLLMSINVKCKTNRRLLEWLDTFSTHISNKDKMQAWIKSSPSLYISLNSLQSSNRTSCFSTITMIFDHISSNAIIIHHYNQQFKPIYYIYLFNSNFKWNKQILLIIIHRFTF